MERSVLTARSLYLAALSLVPLAACGGGGGGGGGGGNDPPKNLTYAHDFALYAKGVAAALNAPTVTGDVTTWSVVPALPAGLSFDGLSGAISGTPTALSATQSYTVRAANAAGFVEASIEVGVVRPATLVLAANSADDTLSSYVVDAGSGQLRPTGYTLTSTGSQYARGLAVHANGRVAYGINRVSADITIYDIDATTGRIEVRGDVAIAGSNPNEIVMHPAADVFYVTQRNGGTHIETFAVDANTGAIASVATLALTNGVESALCDSQGKWLWVANQNANTLTTLGIDPVTHFPSATGFSTTTANKPLSMALSRDERFLYCLTLDGSRVQVYSVDSNTGALAEIQNLQTGLLPARLAIEPSGRFLYVAISSDDTIRTYEIDSATGLLTQIATTPTGSRPGSLCVDATGSFLYTSEIDSGEVGVYSIDFQTGALLRKQAVRARVQPIYMAIVPGDAPAKPHARFAYVANATSGDLSSFTPDPNTGQLISVTQALPSGGQPLAITAHPSGEWMYVAHTADDTVGSYSIDPSTGELAVLGTPVSVGDMPTIVSVDPSGRFVYALAQAASQVDVLAIDPTLGTLSALSSTPVSGQPSGLAVDPSGRFLLVSSATANTISVFEVNKLDGALTPSVVPAPISGAPAALVVHPTGRYALTAFSGTGRLGVFAIDPADGTLSQITTKPAGAEPNSIAVDPTGRFLYVTNYGSAGNGDLTVFKLDTSTDVLTRIEQSLAGLHPVASIVEPSGHYLYVANEGSNDVTRLVINQNTGRVGYPLSTPAGVGPSAITIVGAIQ